jgi:hypothetical protein
VSIFAKQVWALSPSVIKAQRQAISGESDGGFSAMSVPF